jgi:trehalose 6-phosphate phosphatase
MKILNTDTDLDLFFMHMKAARQKALFLDYDGTLAPFHVDPANAHPYPGIHEILNKILQRHDIRLVIVSGRRTKDLLPLLQLNKNPEVWGSHGLEHLKSDGSYELESIDEKFLHALVSAHEWVDRIGLADRCEKKPGCLAIHWRGLDRRQVDNIKNKIDSKRTFITKIWGLRLNEFDGGMEIRVPGIDKGKAVRKTLNEMEKETVAAYLGDDFTDEDAFTAIKGHGIGLLVRKEFRPTEADIWIKPPGELLSFLSDWIS